jgi:hypothetical protein
MSTVVTTELYGAERLNNSVNGNARFKLFTSGDYYVTKSDSACNYDVQNILRDIRGDGFVKVELTLTRAGRVEGIKRA